jgi:hypothetical protein
MTGNEECDDASERGGQFPNTRRLELEKFEKYNHLQHFI